MSNLRVSVESNLWNDIWALVLLQGWNVFSLSDSQPNAVGLEAKACLLGIHDATVTKKI